MLALEHGDLLSQGEKLQTVVFELYIHHSPTRRTFHHLSPPPQQPLRGGTAHGMNDKCVLGVGQHVRRTESAVLPSALPLDSQ